jgi:hypothetical protein
MSKPPPWANVFMEIKIKKRIDKKLDMRKVYLIALIFHRNSVLGKGKLLD